jgi:hypothetical protein
LFTAPLFAAIHIPLQFEGAWTWSEVTVGVAVLFGATPFYRYLLGMHLIDTGGSVLAASVQHASWNAVVDLDGVRGEWQPIAAVILLTVVMAVGRRLWRPESRPMGREVEKREATD